MLGNIYHMGDTINNLHPKRTLIGTKSTRYVLDLFVVPFNIPSKMIQETK